ncbi:MAG: polysaccharide biosynthesis/export family protein [Pseudomonadota bacterium]
MFKHILTLTICLTIAGCGTVYRSSSVRPGPTDGTNVRVVPISGETVVQANRSPYQPKTLPAVFSLTAGTGSGLRGPGALPDPTFDADTPAPLALRLPQPVDPGPYRIGVGDVVLLSTPNAASSVEQLSGLLAAQNARQGYTVQDDGSVNIPNVGRIRIADMTIEDAEDALFQRLVENNIDPTFSLELAEFNSKRVSVGGAVAAPTVVPVALTPVTLDTALAAAGGIAVQDQDFASVRLYRDGALYQIPLTTLFERPDLLRTRLIDGDAVFVDAQYQLDQAASYFEQQIALTSARQSARAAAVNELQAEVGLRRAELDEARSNYRLRTDLGADNRDYVYLTGEVRIQSRFALPYERTASLADALFNDARGVTVDSGDISQIYVLRASDDPREFGAVTAWHLDARNAANFALMTDFQLRPDDVIFIAQQPITKWNRAVSQLVPSLISVTRIATD